MRFLILLMFATVIDLPLSTSEMTYDVSEYEEVESTIRTEKRNLAVSRALSIAYTVPVEYHYFFEEWSYDYDPMSLIRIISVESNWNERALSRINSNGTRDFGMTQLNSQYIDYFESRYWDSENKFDVMNGHHSLYIAAEHLQFLYDSLHNEGLMIQAYNVGIGAIMYNWSPVSASIYLEKVENLWTEGV